MEEKKNNTGLIVVIMLVIACGLGVGGFFIGKNANKDKCETKVEEKKEETKEELDIVRKIKMDTATGDVELNGKFYSLSYENNVLSFDSKKVVSDGGMQSGRYYFVFKATDNKEYLVFGCHSYLGSSVEYIIDDTGKLLKTIDFSVKDITVEHDGSTAKITNGRIAPTQDYTDEYVFVKGGYLYYPKYEGPVSIKNAKYIFNAKYVKVEINNSSIKESETDIVEEMQIYAFN